MLQAAQEIIDQQAVAIEQLRKRLFGRRSEKVSKDQLSLFAQVLAARIEASQEREETDKEMSRQATPPEPKRRHKTPRRPLQPTRIESIPVPEQERPCPQCGGNRCTLDHVPTLVVEYVPPKVEVIEYRRETLVCRACDGEFSTAPLPAERVIDRALPGPNILSALAIHKTVDGLPLHRTKQIFKRSGLDIPIRTLNRWEGYAHQLLVPVVECLKTVVLHCDSINLDDTHLRIRDREAQHGIRNGHIWVFVGRKYDPGGDLSKVSPLCAASPQLYRAPFRIERFGGVASGQSRETWPV